MIKKIKKFWLLNYEDKRLLLEAFFYLTLTRFLMLFLSFKGLTRGMNHSQSSNILLELSKLEQKEAIRVGRAVELISNYTPWHSSCLNQALSVAKMLKRRDISFSLFLGVAKDAIRGASIKAHAWIKCGSSIVIGGGNLEDFVVVSTFYWEAKGKDL